MFVIFIGDVPRHVDHFIFTNLADKQLTILISKTERNVKLFSAGSVELFPGLSFRHPSDGVFKWSKHVVITPRQNETIGYICQCFLIFFSDFH